ncbi:hypothetical protein AM228_04835 [Planktothricoides sp. SR001]|nr:hypothetical protein AM228_04835 [Planktothricoides sp. SR001]
MDVYIFIKLFKAHWPRKKSLTDVGVNIRGVRLLVRGDRNSPSNGIGFRRLQSPGSDRHST